MWLIANTLHTECHQLTHLPLLRFTLVGALIPFSHAGFTVVVKSLYTLHNGHKCNRKLACNDFFELFFSQYICNDFKKEELGAQLLFWIFSGPHWYKSIQAG